MCESHADGIENADIQAITKKTEARFDIVAQLFRIRFNYMNPACLACASPGLFYPFYRSPDFRIIKFSGTA